MESTQKAMCNCCVNNIKMDFSLLKLEIHPNRTQKVSCYRTMQIPSLITVLFRENAGVFNRKIIRKYTINGQLLNFLIMKLAPTLL